MADDSTTTVPEDEGVTDTGGSATDTDTGQQDDESTPGSTAGLGVAGKKALDAERRARKAAERTSADAQKRLDDLNKRIQEFEDQGKSDLDKLQGRAEAAAKERDEARREADVSRIELMKFRVARDKKLPAEWIDRLRGSSKGELEDDADALLAVLKEQEKRRTPSYDGGVRQPANTKTDMNSLIRRKAGLG